MNRETMETIETDQPLVEEHVSTDKRRVSNNEVIGLNERGAINSGNVIDKFRLMLEMIRFSHTLFALPFALLALAMAVKMPLPNGGSVSFSPLQLLAVLFCMVCARSTAMAFNRLVDQRFDADNPRTSGRHLPSGLLRRNEVAFFTLVCGLGFIAGTLLFLPNWLPLAASVPVLLFLCGYSLAKRFTSAAHLWLGVALSLAPVCVWVAVRGTVLLTEPTDGMPALLLALAVACWVTGFDIIYACQDENYDRSAGLHSVPVRFGARGAFRIAAGFHALMVILLLALPAVAAPLHLGWLFYTSVVGIAALLAYEHWLVRPNDLDRINHAFFHVNAIVSLVLLLAGTLDCWFV
ncbi:MAG: 4-hydroxybenzoate octaprenyltransferase [Pirellulaceae bacterium]